MFYERLRDLLDHSDISTKELAFKLGLSPSALRNYARGYREPDFEILLRIAAYFNVTTDYLLGNTADNGAVNEEKKLLSMWNQFTAGQKSMVLEYMQLITNYRIFGK